MFGKDYIQEAKGVAEDRIEGNLSTGYYYLWDKGKWFGDEKITLPTTATSVAMDELLMPSAVDGVRSATGEKFMTISLLSSREATKVGTMECSGWSLGYSWRCNY